MGKDTNDLDTRQEDKERREGREDEPEEDKMTALDSMEAIEKLVEEWQDGSLNAEEALEQINILIE